MKSHLPVDGSVLPTPSAYEGGPVRPMIKLAEAGPQQDAPESGTVRRRFGSIARWMALTDAVCIFAALLFSFLLRFNFSRIRPDYLLVLLLAPLVWLLVFRAFALYSPQRMSRAEELRRTVSAVGVGLVFIAVASYWTKSELSRGWLAMSAVMALSFEVLIRSIWRYSIGSWQKNGRLAYRTLILGTQAEAEALVRVLGTSGGFIPIGHVDFGNPTDQTNHSILNQVEHLRRLILESRAECVFVASPNLGPREMLGVAQVARRTGIELRVHTHLNGVLTTRLSVLPVGSGAMAISFRLVSLSGLQKALKRGLDVAAAVLGLILVAPIIAVAAAAIKVSSPGPVLFRQIRVTEGGRKFTMLKFRTMAWRSDGRRLDQATPFFKMKDDPRLTRVGRLLRSLSIDELPQLVNVVRGEMSLVGPRPLPYEQVAANPDLLKSRHEVRAGITGWWQINGRSELSPEDALSLDLFYIENWSLALDLYILLRTFLVLLTRRGAF